MIISLVEKSKVNGLQINEDETHHIDISKNRTPSNMLIIVNGKRMKCVESSTYLGTNTNDKVGHSLKIRCRKYA